jgi:hypothetical protein
VLQNYFHDQNEQYESGTSTSAQRRFKNTVHLDSIVARSKRTTGGMRPDASENSQISSSTIVRAARTATPRDSLAARPEKREYSR